MGINREINRIITITITTISAAAIADEMVFDVLRDGLGEAMFYLLVLSSTYYSSQNSLLHLPLID